MGARGVWLLSSLALEYNCWICKGKILCNPVFPILPYPILPMLKGWLYQLV